MKKLSNLEAFYIQTKHVKPFSKLSNIEKWHLENSREFRDFKNMNRWTRGIMYFILALAIIVLFMAIATNL